MAVWRGSLAGKTLLCVMVLAAAFGAAHLRADKAAKTASPQAAQHFEQQVAPILRRCVFCHSGDAPQGGLDLSTRQSALAGGKSGPALAPGQGSESLIYTMTAARLMPPGEPLTEAETSLLRQWIDAGAGWETALATTAAPKQAERAGLDWWALEALQKPQPPATGSESWARNAIDRFVLAKLQAEGLEPSPPADRRTLIRRLSFDLTGLPPAPEDVEAFLADSSPQAYELLVERLLASPRYGERWGRHWLDVARFGESQGYERDKIREHAWGYRDYVIRSFNADKPYDRFVKEQLAGDVLEPVTRDGIVATGFLVAGPWDEVGNQQQSKIMRERVRQEDLEDMVGTVSQTFLGMTVNCARCHDHKFDPIPQRDFYRVQAAFAGVWHGDRSILTPAETAEREQRLAPLKQRARELEAEIAGIEESARLKVLAERGPQPGEDLPQPDSRWTFDVDAKDSVGGLHGRLTGGAEVYGGRLRFCEGQGTVRTAAIEEDLREKTFEAWLTLPDPAQPAVVIGIVNRQALGVNDTVAYGEKKWRNASEYSHRTQDAEAPVETAAAGDRIHLAVVYGTDDRIRIYRNGTLYQPPYLSEVKGPEGKLQTFPANTAYLQLGGGWAEIDELRMYRRALSAAEIARSFQAGAPSVMLPELLERMTPEDRQRREQLLTQLKQQQEALQAIPAEPLGYAANGRRPPPTHVLARGDPLLRKEAVSAGGLSAVKGLSADFRLRGDAPEGVRRLRFAEWVTDPRNPLTARVMVNRLWHYHFGRGIVATPNDFGFNGERPSHPELLDWLAGEFIARGWSIKSVQRLIVLSNTYRQSSGFQARAAEQDPQNRWLWRFGARRLEAEAIRDAMLAAGGQLNTAMGGPGYRPFNIRIFNSHFYDLIDPDEPEYNRRTVYRIVVRSARDPLLEAFDCPDASEKEPKRSITTTPIQSLGLMNNSFVLRQARYLAKRAEREAGGSTEAEVERAYRLALGRAPTGRESERAVAHVRDHGLESLAWTLFNSSEFLYLN